MLYLIRESKLSMNVDLMNKVCMMIVKILRVFSVSEMEDLSNTCKYICFIYFVK